MEIPFQYGKIVEDDCFIDRIEDRKELKGFLSNGINTILVSPRRWGKSSLVKVAMKELAEEDKNIKVCFLDAFKIHSEEEFYDAFASAVIEGVSSTAEKRWGDFVKYIKSISPTISFNDSPTTSVSLNLKFDPLKSNAESILNLPEKWRKTKESRSSSALMSSSSWRTSRNGRNSFPQCARYGSSNTGRHIACTGARCI